LKAKAGGGTWSLREVVYRPGLDQRLWACLRELDSHILRSSPANASRYGIPRDYLE
jgi:hypothetical protein